MWVKLEPLKTKLALDLDKTLLANAMAVTAMGIISARLTHGLDMHGRPFKPYSASYKRALALEGMNSKVDIALSGGLLQSLHTLRTWSTPTLVASVIGVDSSPSRFMPLLPPWIKPEQRRAWRKVQLAKPHHGVPHNVLGAWIHNGTGRMPARPWLGLSPKDQADLSYALELFVSRRPVVRVD